jgi:2-phospho-L-lactate guanylyltransferase
MGPVAVLIPVKAFTEAKVRLAPAMDPAARADLSRSMADHVMTAAGSLPVAVVCDDPEVAAWAESRGAVVIDEDRPGRGLNGAVRRGVVHLAAAGVQQVIVAHADLPFATDLAWVARFPGVTLVPDRHDDGTNVACIPAAVAETFEFAYGPSSFRRHVAEARRLGLNLRIVHEPSLAWDVDIPTDLAATAPATAP